jgi:hypothetical protein
MLSPLQGRKSQPKKDPTQQATSAVVDTTAAVAGADAETEIETAGAGAVAAGATPNQTPNVARELPPTAREFVHMLSLQQGRQPVLVTRNCDNEISTK